MFKRLIIFLFFKFFKYLQKRFEIKIRRKNKKATEKKLVTFVWLLLAP